MKVTSIVRYPVKSCAGVTADSATVASRGLKHDRRWVIVDDTGVALTGREQVAIPLMHVALRDDGIELQRPGVAACHVGTPSGERRQTIRVWSDSVDAADAGDAPAHWLSTMLGQPVRLCFMDQSAHRPAGAGDVSFADAWPVLLTCTASLKDLEERAGVNIAMQRFRPNVVIETAEPWAEDRWRRIRLGNMVFDVVEPCERCNFTTIDPDTGASHPRQEPLRTLATFRRDASGGVCFGQNLCAVDPGEIHLGDSVEVLDEGDPRPALA